MAGAGRIGGLSIADFSRLITKDALIYRLNEGAKAPKIRKPLKTEAYIEVAQA